MCQPALCASFSGWNVPGEIQHMCSLHICGFNVFRTSVYCNEKSTEQLLSNPEKRRARCKADVTDDLQ